MRGIWTEQAWERLLETVSEGHRLLRPDELVTGE
jgi:hypothetical protein